MKTAAYLLLVAATVAAVIVLREETMSRHTSVDPDTELHIVVRATSNVADAPLPRMVDALFLMCQLEVAGEPVAAPRLLEAGTFLLRVRPALDATDRLQITGCLEDARIDRLQASVRAMRQVSVGDLAAAGDRAVPGGEG